MAEYDITMKQYDGAGYNTLYPKNVSQQVLLNDSAIATALGIVSANPTITEAISKIINRIVALENNN